MNKIKKNPFWLIYHCMAFAFITWFPYDFTHCNCCVNLGVLTHIISHAVTKHFFFLFNKFRMEDWMFNSLKYLTNGICCILAIARMSDTENNFISVRNCGVCMICNKKKQQQEPGDNFHVFTNRKIKKKHAN